MGNSKSKGVDFRDFVEIFQRAAESADETEALGLVSEMEALGADWESAESVRLGVLEGRDHHQELTPLAWAANLGLKATAEALLEAGADPEFGFRIREGLWIGTLDLAQGWSLTARGVGECERLIRAALEKKALGRQGEGAEPDRNRKAKARPL